MGENSYIENELIAIVNKRRPAFLKNAHQNKDRISHEKTDHFDDFCKILPESLDKKRKKSSLLDISIFDDDDSRNDEIRNSESNCHSTQKSNEEFLLQKIKTFRHLRNLRKRKISVAIQQMHSAKWSFCCLFFYKK